MDDTTRTALDAEAPVNPYSLLDALNTAAARTNAIWLLFLGLMAYLALGVAGLTHRDLLLDAGVVLPLLNTRIGLAPFFVAAPAVLALAHVALIAQFVLLARKAVEFDGAVRLLESTELRTHPLRLEVDSFFFAQGLAGPERGRAVGAILHGLGWLTLLLLPLGLLLSLQVAFLPFHAAGVTLAQRIIVLADIAVMLLAGVFLVRAETSFPRAALRLAFRNPGSAAFGLAALAGAAVVAVAATVPGAAASAGAPLFGVFPRSLELADASLISERASVMPVVGRTISLRGRDLRFARLDRADLRQADLTGARLDGASLAGADLRGSRMGCANKTDCTSAKGADFTGAQLGGAVLAGADLTGARLDEASLERADLTRAVLTGASLERARLMRADLSSALLQGASLAQANLQGATLTDVGLETADLTGAALQGASLVGAHLAGTVLRAADLDGARLQRARVYGTDLRGARLVAADLADAEVWQALPPTGDATALADVASIAITPPAASEIEALQAVLARVEAAQMAMGEKRTARLKGLLADIGVGAWEGSSDGQAWAALVKASETTMAEGFKARLSEHLAHLACRTRFAESVAGAVVTRAVSAGFKGDVVALHDRLKAGDCVSLHTIPRGTLLDLAALAETARTETAVIAPPPGSGAVQGQ